MHFTVSSTLLCPTHYCVQHIIVSNKILCPHLPKGSFVHISHFNMLRSYHAALAKHLSYIIVSVVFRLALRIDMSFSEPSVFTTFLFPLNYVKFSKITEKNAADHLVC